MLKKSQSLKGLSSSATKPRSDTQNIHIAFKQWVQKLKVYQILAYQFDNTVFLRDESGEYARLTVRALFEVFQERERKKNTFLNGVVGGLVGVAITALLFFAFGVY